MKLKKLILLPVLSLLLTGCKAVTATDLPEAKTGTISKIAVRTETKKGSKKNSSKVNVEFYTNYIKYVSEDYTDGTKSKYEQHIFYRDGVGGIVTKDNGEENSSVLNSEVAFNIAKLSSLGNVVALAAVAHLTATHATLSLYTEEYIENVNNQEGQSAKFNLFFGTYTGKISTNDGQLVVESSVTFNNDLLTQSKVTTTDKRDGKNEKIVSQFKVTYIEELKSYSGSLPKVK